MFTSINFEEGTTARLNRMEKREDDFAVRKQCERSASNSSEDEDDLCDQSGFVMHEPHWVDKRARARAQTFSR